MKIENMNNYEQPRKKGSRKSIQKVAEFNEYARFMALPDVMKMQEYGYKTSEAFSGQWKVNKDTLYEWKKQEVFWKTVRDLLRIWGKTKTPNVIASLYKTIMQKGQGNDVMIWFKIIEGFKENDPALEAEEETRKSLKDIQDNVRAIVAQGKGKPFIKSL